jgi:DNA polymerase type B, organellar and viral
VEPVAYYYSHPLLSNRQGPNWAFGQEFGYGFEIPERLLNPDIPTRYDIAVPSALRDQSTLIPAMIPYDVTLDPLTFEYDAGNMNIAAFNCITTMPITRQGYGTYKRLTMRPANGNTSQYCKDHEVITEIMCSIIYWADPQRPMVAPVPHPGLVFDTVRDDFLLPYANAYYVNVETDTEGDHRQYSMKMVGLPRLTIDFDRDAKQYILDNKHAMRNWMLNMVNNEHKDYGAWLVYDSTTGLPPVINPISTIISLTLQYWRGNAAIQLLRNMIFPPLPIGRVEEYHDEVDENEEPAVGCTSVMESNAVEEWKRTCGANYIDWGSKMDNNCVFEAIFESAITLPPVIRILDRERQIQIIRALMNAEGNQPLPESVVYRIASFLNVILKVYHIITTKGRRRVALRHTIGPHGMHQVPRQNILRLAMVKVSNIEHYGRFILHRTRSWNTIYGRNGCMVCHKWFNAAADHFLRCEKCTFCGTPHLSGDNHDAHCRGPRRMIYRNYLEDKDNVMRKSVKNENLTLDFLQYIWFCDIETFYNSDDKEKKHYAYTICMKKVGENAKIWTGPDCLREWFEYLITTRHKGTVYFWNASGFDGHILIEHMVKYHPEMFTEKISKSMMRKGSRLLRFKLRVRPCITVCDIYLMIPMSLKAAGKAFNVPVESRKTKYDHSKIHSWTDIHYPTVSAYILRDVQALEAITIKFATMVAKTFGVSIVKMISLPHLAQTVWTGMMHKEWEIKLPSVEEDKIFRAGYYGGRVTANTPCHLSAYYHWCMDNTEEGINENQYKRIDDEICYYDRVSLYPAVMFGRMYPHGTYTYVEFDNTKLERLRELSEAELLGWCETIYFCGVKGWFEKDIIQPPLPRRDANGSVNFTLEDINNGYYYGRELGVAILCGFHVTSIEGIYMWKGSAPIYREYVAVCYKGKKDAKETGNAGMYQLYKLLLNSLSGKPGQKMILQDWLLVNLETLSNIHHDMITQMFPFDNLLGQVSLWGVTKLREKVEVTNAVYLSGFILANARAHNMIALLHGGHLKSKKYRVMYGDTDSAIARKGHWSKLPHEEVGEELGQYMQEYANGKIIGLFVLAKKTYCMVIMLPCKDGQYRPHVTVRCKGIPHCGKLVLHKSEETYLSQEIETGEEWVDLKRILYEVKNEMTHEAYYVSRLGPETFMKVQGVDPVTCNIGDHYKVKAIFGTLKRLIGRPGKLGIASQWFSRSLVSVDWWERQTHLKRAMDNEDLFFVDNLYREKEEEVDVE